MDKTTVLENLGKQTAFSLRSQRVAGDMLRMAINEAVVNLSLLEDEEIVFRQAVLSVIDIFGPPDDAPAPYTLSLC